LLYINPFNSVQTLVYSAQICQLWGYTQPAGVMNLVSQANGTPGTGLLSSTQSASLLRFALWLSRHHTVIHGVSIPEQRAKAAAQSVSLMVY
jgi:hypothetical protein